MTKGTFKAILIGAVCILIIMILFTNAFKPRLKFLQDMIAEMCGGNTEITIDMSDLTDFEWEQCIVYRPGTQTKDIQETFHVNYDTYLDLCSGIIFVNDHEVVYEEFFKDIEYDFTNKTPEFLIYPYGENESPQTKYACFEKTEAKFKCIRQYYEYKGLFGDKGYYYYRLYSIK